MQNPITITDEALNHLRSLSACPEAALGIRIGLRDAGCSGFAYTVDYAKQHDPEDQVFDFDDVKIVIAADKLSALQGMRLYLAQKGLNSILSFDNPNVVATCGCGESIKFAEK